MDNGIVGASSTSRGITVGNVVGVDASVVIVGNIVGVDVSDILVVVVVIVVIVVVVVIGKTGTFIETGTSPKRILFNFSNSSTIGHAFNALSRRRRASHRRNVGERRICFTEAPLGRQKTTGNGDRMNRS